MSVRRPIVFLGVSCFALLLLGFAGAAHAPHRAPRGASIAISPVIPADIPGGAAQADLATAGRFAWSEFVALNWPATQARRDEADLQRAFGSGGPVVWETLRQNNEIAPVGGSATQPPHGYSTSDPSFGYDDAPFYPYSTTATLIDGKTTAPRPGGVVPPCDAAASTDRAAWVNLDASTQLGYAHLYAGTLGDQAGSGNVFRFASKANRTMYTYLASKHFWYGWVPPWDYVSGGKPLPPDAAPILVAAVNFEVAMRDGFPAGGAYRTNRVDFPNGTIEIKAAFRRLTAAEQRTGRYYTTKARSYDWSAGTPSVQCWREDVWGLAGLHIMQKTASAPAFTYATFEQADLLGPGVEDDDGTPLTTGPVTKPPVSYQDGVYSKACDPKKEVCLPRVTLGDGACKPAKNVFYTQLSDNGKATRMPVGRTTCYERRLRRIPQAIVGVNRDAHASIRDYEAAHGVQSPWRYYKLINVQVLPFDLSEIGGDETPRGAPTYYTSNVAAEANYTTESFTGGFPSVSGDAPSKLASNSPFILEQGNPKQFQNAFLLKPNSDLQKRSMMGGCMGCHGISQVSGGDWSFISLVSATNDPDAYTPDPAPGKEAPRFQDMFQRLAKSVR
jgi:hypothetical protein